ncbi:MAG: M3 family oligoendopeptidase, partial [Intestinibacter sp.]
MSKKLSLIVIIIFSLIFITGVFYRINKFDQKEEIYTQVASSFDNQESKNEDDEQSNYKYVTWNLQDLFKSDDAWEKELAKFENDIKELENYTGKITKSKTHFMSALKIKEKLDIRIDKLYAYAKLKRDINKDSYKCLDMIDKVNKVDSRYSKISSDLELEILKLSDSTYDKYLKNSKVNKKYKTYLEEIRKSKDHYLDEKSEDILSKLGNITSLPSNIYDLFSNMDKNSKNSPSEYSNKIKSTDRNTRKDAYTNEFIPYNDNINTLSGLLIGQVNKNVFYSSVRKYNSSLDMYLSDDEVDPKIYNNLIDTVNKNKDSLHKYVSLRKKLLNIDKVHYYDMFVPIVQADNSDIPYGEA